MALDGPGEAAVRGNTLLDGTGLHLHSDLTGIIEDNDLSGGMIGIGAGSSPTVRNNVLRAPAPVSGENEITDFEIGINLGAPGSDGHVVGNTAAGYSIGIHVDQGTAATVEGNDLTGNGFGIAWDSEMTGVVNENAVRGGNTGIAITEGDPSVTGNTVEGAKSDGIFVGAMTQPTLRGNTLCGSETNLYIDDSADPVIGENEICPDKDPASD